MKQLTILLVDDNEDLLEGLAVLLEDEGHEVTLASTGEGAVEQSRCKPFDLIFVDFKLFGIDGIEVCSRICKSRPDARVFIMTGYRVEQMLDCAVENGATRVLRTPFTMPRMLRSLRDVLPEGIVLVVDGDPEFPEHGRSFLEAQNYRILLARTGREAVDGMKKNPVDVVVLDLRLPVIRGLDVYRELKQAGNAVPMVLITSHAEEQGPGVDVLRSPAATGCFFKPFDPEVLLDLIDEIVVSGN